LKQEHGGQVDVTTVTQLPQLDLTIEKCYDFLVEILESFVILDLFDGYMARWGTTFDKVLATNRGSSLLTQSFRGCSREAPPVLPTQTNSNEIGGSGEMVSKAGDKRMKVNGSR